MSAQSTPHHFLVLPAAGAGRRMHQRQPKQYQSLLGKPLLQHTLERIAAHPVFDRTVVALAADDPYWQSLASTLPGGLRMRISTVTGGADRAASVRAALAALAGQAREDDWVLVHDAVRPCLERLDLNTLLDTIKDEPVGGILATPVRETVKAASVQGYVTATVDRSQLWLAATPQMFRYGLLCRALDAARAQGLEATDEAAAVEAWLAGQGAQAPGAIRLVPCSLSNLKITYPQDLPLAALLLGEQSC